MGINNCAAIGFVELCTLAVGEVHYKVPFGFYAYRQAQMDVFFT